MIAGLYRCHAVPNGFDDAGRFMTENRRRASWQRSVNAVKVTVAHAACDGADQHFGRAGPVDLDLLNGEGLVGRTHNRGFDSHGISCQQAPFFIRAREYCTSVFHEGVGMPESRRIIPISAETAIQPADVTRL